MNRVCTCALLAGLMLLSSLSHADDYLKRIKHFSLLDQMMINRTISEYEDRDYIVVYIQGTGCPIARSSVPAYKEVAAQHRASNIAFLMLNPFIQDNMHRIQKEVEMYDIHFPVLKDDDQTVAWSLGVERTAEIFIIDPRTREVKFRGPVNDQFDYEVRNLEAKNHYLSDAIDTLLAGGTINMDNIPESKGCLVGYFHPAVAALKQ